jgi:hypothetical protein
MKKSLEAEKLAAATTTDPRWLSVVERDKKSDGDFYYSVKTTRGVLPPILRSAARAPGERAVPQDDGRRREGWVQAMQTLQTFWPVSE